MKFIRKISKFINNKQNFKLFQWNNVANLRKTQKIPIFPIDN